jgi:hypothetical protein
MIGLPKKGTDHQSQWDGSFETKQERHMEKFDELTIDEMTVDELDVVSGGTWRTQTIHIDYKNLNNFDDPTAVRIA